MSAIWSQVPERMQGFHYTHKQSIVCSILGFVRLIEMFMPPLPFHRIVYQGSGLQLDSPHDSLGPFLVLEVVVMKPAVPLDG